MLKDKDIDNYVEVSKYFSKEKYLTEDEKNFVDNNSFETTVKESGMDVSKIYQLIPFMINMRYKKYLLLHKEFIPQLKLKEKNNYENEDIMYRTNPEYDHVRIEIEKYINTIREQNLNAENGGVYDYGLVNGYMNKLTGYGLSFPYINQLKKRASDVNNSFKQNVYVSKEEYDKQIQEDEDEMLNEFLDLHSEWRKNDNLETFKKYSEIKIILMVSGYSSEKIRSYEDH